MSDQTEMLTIAQAKKGLTNEEQMQMEVSYNRERKDPTVAFLLSFFLGGLGVDRFYLGHIGLGIGKLLTLGGVGIWAIVDWFLIRGATRAHNAAAISDIRRIVVMSRPDSPGTEAADG